LLSFFLINMGVLLNFLLNYFKKSNTPSRAELPRRIKSKRQQAKAYK
jgi:hypothetical protein